jgi:nucleoside-diphosphate-sugar epimerase
MHAKRVAILGANGRLGREAALAFRDAGWKVRAIARTGKGPIAGIEHATADAMAAEELIEATRGCDAMFNGLNPPYTQWREFVLPMARNVIAAAKVHGALHLFPGNVYNFGTTIPAQLNEATPFAPDHAKARIRVEAEALFAQAAARDGVRTIVIRAGDFFGGAGTGSWFDQALASKLDRGKFVYPGSLDIEHAWAYLPDLARAFVAVAERGAKLPAFDTFHFGGHNVTGRQMLAACEIAIGAKLKSGAIPWPLLRLAGLFSPMMREVSAMAYLWRRPHALTGAKLEAFAGPLAQTPLEEAVRQALADLGIGQARAAA